MYHFEFPDLNTQWQVLGQLFDSIATICAVFLAVRLALRGEEARVRRNIIPLIFSDIKRMERALEMATSKGSDPVLVENVTFGNGSGYIFREHGVYIGSIGPEISATVIEYYEALSVTASISEGNIAIRRSRVSLADAILLHSLAQQALAALDRGRA